jgi:hypothetical protein
LFFVQMIQNQVAAQKRLQKFYSSINLFYLKQFNF